MTQLLVDSFGADWARSLDPFFVGFDNTFDQIRKTQNELTKMATNYPPYNIKKVNDDKYVVEIAVAGFSKENIEITLEDNKLIIKGNCKEDSDHFLYKGIASRAFTRTFVLSDNVEVQSADIINGMLTIFLENIIPEHKKPKKIAIGSSKSDKQLLTENK